MHSNFSNNARPDVRGAVGGSVERAATFDSADLRRKRAVILSARLQFSPDTQSIREGAIDRAVARTLAPFDEGLTASEIIEFLTLSIGIKNSAISVYDVSDALKRLAARSDVEIGGRTDPRYRLSRAAAKRVEEAEQAAERRIETVFSRLFPGESYATSEYAKAFLDFASRVFASLAETYVRLLQNNVNAEALLGSPVFKRALRKTTVQYTIDEARFAAAATRFFREPDPDFSALQWNLTQGYYVAKCIGLDPSGALLSAEMLRGANFYLDTNVALPALSSYGPSKTAFDAVARACETHGATLAISQITLDELRSVVQANRIDFERLVPKIPEATASKVRNIFLEERRRTDSVVSTDSIFARFDKPAEQLEALGVRRFDDRWFDDENDTISTGEAVRRVISRSERRLSGPKSNRTARHDALMLRWVDAERSRGATNTWFVTLDRTLPLTIESAESNSPLAITLDALLHWISAATLTTNDEADVARIYSQALRYQILPCDNFFDITDFGLFADLEFDSRNMPAEDVEGCIRELKAKFGSVNPRDPKHREDLARSFARYWADPARKYRSDVVTLESRVTNLTSELAERTAVSDAQAATIRDLAGNLNELVGERDALAAARRKVQSTIRNTFAGVVFLVFCAAAVWAAVSFGEGGNWWQRIVESAELVVPSIAAAAGIAAVVSGNSSVRRMLGIEAREEQ